MKFLMSLFDLRGLKLWLIGLVLAVNLILTSLFFVGANAILAQQGGWTDGMDITLMLGIFLLTSLIGFGVAYLSRSERGMSYAVWGAIGSFAMASVMLYEAGLLAFLVATMALMGGYNGGLLGQRMSLKRKNK